MGAGLVLGRNWKSSRCSGELPAAGLKDAEVAGGPASVRSLGFILTFSVKKAQEMSDAGTRVHRPRKAAQQVEGLLGAKGKPSWGFFVCFFGD